MVALGYHITDKIAAGRAVGGGGGGGVGGVGGVGGHVQNRHMLFLRRLLLRSLSSCLVVIESATGLFLFLFCLI